MKSYRSDLVDRFRHRQRLWTLTHLPVPGVDAQVQFQRPVDSMHAFVVPDEVLDVTQALGSTSRSASSSGCKSASQSAITAFTFDSVGW